ncbi:MAG: IS607 family transposase, partial [Synergistaceae bacterium]|nr:IS607 family transposase [Synergistaceae bacterium]
RLYSVEQAAQLSGLHPNTIRNWADEGKIYSTRTKGGHRRVDISEYIMPKPEEKIGQKYTICYCRVSSAKQRDDLNRQVAYMREQYPDAEIVKEIGSGINFKRNGLCRILERAMRGDVITLVVAYKDRLARFGADIIEFVLNQNGGKLVVLNEVSLSPEEELTRDLLTILHVFSCRLHGLRKYKYEISKDTNLSDKRAEANFETMAGDIEVCLQQDD